MEEPLVSVVIDNYNYAAFLEDSIESVLRQSYARFEVIVVDDGSTDDSRQILEQYARDARIKVIFKENGGQASAFNAGFFASTGALVCFLDSDDLFTPGKLARIVDLFNQFPQAGWLTHPLEWLFSDGSRRPNFQFGQAVECRDLRPDFRRGSIKTALSATSALCFRRGLLERIFPLPEEMRITVDNLIKYCACGLQPVILLNECQAVQRIHSSNAYTLSPARQSMAVEIHFAISKQLKRKVPKAGALSFRLAGNYLGQALQLSGWQKAVQYAMQVSRDLGLPARTGAAMLLGWGLLGILKRKMSPKSVG